MEKLLEKHPRYYYVSSKGIVCNGFDAKPQKTVLRKKFGNYFRSKKLAEIAVVRMSNLFRRLKK